VLSICGSRRKGPSTPAPAPRASFAPPDMKIAAAPPWASFPITCDIRTRRLPARHDAVEAIRARRRDLRDTEYNYSIRGSECDRLGFRVQNQPLKDKPWRSSRDRRPMGARACNTPAAAMVFLTR